MQAIHEADQIEALLSIPLRACEFEADLSLGCRVRGCRAGMGSTGACQV